MNTNFDNNNLLTTNNSATTNQNNNHESSSSPVSSPVSSSSSPSSSSGGSSSSSELNPSDALQSPLAGLLNFEGFSMPQIRNFNISNIDMPNFSNLPPLPALPSFNMPNFQQRIPDLANNLRTNLSNFQNLTTNMPNFRNLSYLSQLTNVYTSAELQNLFNLFRISTNLPNLPTLPQLPPLFSPGQFSKGRLLKPWGHLRDSVRSMHRRLNDITQRFPTNFHFYEWQTANGVDFIRIYFLLNEVIYYCDSHIGETSLSSSSSPSISSSKHQQYGGGGSPSPSTSSASSNKHQHPSSNRSSGGSSVGGGSSHNNSNSNSNNKHEILNTQPLHPNIMLVGNYNHIQWFEYDPKRSRFVFTVDKNLYYFDDQPGQNQAPHVPIKIETNCPYIKTDFRICPSNPDLISFHCRGDIWCVNIKTSQEIKLTNVFDDCKPSIPSPNGNSDDNHTCDQNKKKKNNNNNNNNNNKPIVNPSVQMDSSQQMTNKTYSPDAASILVGRPSHVIREEFRRHQGFWWRPESEYHVVIDSEDFSEYQLLYEETDQSQVEIVNLPSWDGTIEEQRFPKAGRQNPKSKLKMIKFKISSKDNLIQHNDIIRSDIIPNLSEIYSEYEYLLRAGWIGQETIWCQLLNRRQTHLVIVIISLSNSFESQIIYEEINDIYWVSVHDIFYFLNAPKVDHQPLVEGSELSFIWSSEETGFRHIYFIKVKLGGKTKPAKVIMKKQLTEGQWEVNEKDFWVDEEEMLIYFCGLRDTPLEKQLYTLSYADCINDKHHHSHHHHHHNHHSNKTKIHRLTELNYNQSNIAFNANCSIYINIQSNISVPPFGFVNLIVPQTKFRRDSRRLPDSKRLALLLVNSYHYPFSDTSHLNYLKSIGTRQSIMYDCQADLLPGLARPELFCCQLANGELIYGSVFKPEFMESGVRYPCVLEIYGGPEIQLVSNNFMSLRHPGRHLLSSEGYVVVLIDCRGSGRRGISFEAHTYLRMGQVEIADQIEVLKWLAKNTGYIDLTRVAVKGWSYGGYLALMALAQYPKVFKLAIAGAPVTNWQLYDSAYTERFMGLPNENQDGYHKGNVLNYVHMFPDQENRLLILHGMMDENVHFAHTTTLIKALIEAGKPYDLQVFPVERHLLKNPMSCENFMTCVLSYLQLNL